MVTDFFYFYQNQADQKHQKVPCAVFFCPWLEMKNNIKKIIVVYHDKYFIAKFALILDKRESIDTID